MDSKQNLVFNIFNAPKGKASPHGEHIYEWEYLDEKGEIHKDKRNVQEQIQSFLPTVDYKKQIQRGELELNDTNVGSSIKDFTGIPRDTVDIYKFLSALSSLSAEQVANIMEQTNKANQSNVQGTQGGDKTSAVSGQTPATTNENKPAVSQSSGNNDVGGK